MKAFQEGQKTFQAIGVAIGLLGALLSLLPWGGEIEESITLDGLFLLRGHRPAPPSAVVVGINDQTMAVTGLPRQLDRWSRAEHARIVERLSQAGSSAIIFDLLFNESRDTVGDQAFAAALGRHRHVVLSATVAEQTISSSTVMEKIRLPVPEFRQAALATAPFLLPKDSGQVRQVWLFRQDSQPTLPVVALQVTALPLYGEFLNLLATVDPVLAVTLPANAAAVSLRGEMQTLMQLIRHEFIRQPHLQSQMMEALARANLNAADYQLLQALITVYGGPNSRYLNFYGSSGHLSHIPYERLLNQKFDLGSTLEGRAVFVGFADRQVQAQRDVFKTVFSDANGTDLPGVEIAATAYANLFHDEFIRSMPGYVRVLITVIWALILTGLFGQWALRRGGLITVLMALAYSAVVYVTFIRTHGWLPWAVPILVQTPLILLAAMIWRYTLNLRRRKQLRQAFSHYLPASVVHNLDNSTGEVLAGGQVVHTACLATDAASYTSLAETLSPGDLAALLNDYYEVLFSPVRRRRGIISDVVGDAMLALWTHSQPDESLRIQACAAALDICDDLRQFNSQQAYPLITRLGLHSGQVLLGNVGASDHYEFRAVGDVVNTANRIQGLNKQLGTCILASQETVIGQAGLLCRPVGNYVLAGKASSVTIYEVMGLANSADDVLRRYLAEFAQALAVFQSQRWHEAAEMFRALLKQRPEDGPARFLLDRSEGFLRHPPPADWNGSITLVDK